MDTVYKISLLLLTIIISFSSLASSSDGRTTQLGNQNLKGGHKGEISKREDQKTIPRDLSIEHTSPGEESTGFAFDPYDSLAPMYFPASTAGFQDMEIVKDGYRSVDGLNRAPIFNGYLQGYDGARGGDYGSLYGYPYPGGIGFPRGIFGFPRFRLPRRIFGFPRGYGGFPGGYGGFPGGYGWFPGGCGGNPGGYGGNPGGYGRRGPGDRHGGRGYPGSGGKAQVRGKEVNPHD